MDVPVLTVYDDDGNEIPIPAIRGADGAPGATPVKGIDYWTAGDKTEIVSDVLEELYQGADIGLQIVTQLNQPANPADNMIWVETETSMPTGKYMVSSRRPTTGLVNGFLWFREMYLPLVEITLPGSHVSMSVAQVWQYENGAWVWKAGHVYKAADEEWKDTGVYWFKSGVGFNNAVFGGFYSDGDAGIVSDGSCVYVGSFHSSQAGYACVASQGTIQPGTYKYMIAEIQYNSRGPSYTFQLGAAQSYMGTTYYKSTGINQTMNTTIVVDISDVNNPFVPKFSGDKFCRAEIYNAWFV